MRGVNHEGPAGVLRRTATRDPALARRALRRRRGGRGGTFSASGRVEGLRGGPRAPRGDGPSDGPTRPGLRPVPRRSHNMPAVGCGDVTSAGPRRRRLHSFFTARPRRDGRRPEASGGLVATAPRPASSLEGPPGRRGRISGRRDGAARHAPSPETPQLRRRRPPGRGVRARVDPAARPRRGPRAAGAARELRRGARRRRPAGREASRGPRREESGEARATGRGGRRRRGASARFRRPCFPTR